MREYLEHQTAMADAPRSGPPPAAIPVDDPKYHVTTQKRPLGDYAKPTMILMRCSAQKKRGVKKLKGDGDFRSEECIEYLKQADIVVTNPPFTLFREYVALLMKYEKRFLIIGNQNNITYKEIFPLIRQNKIWLGWKFGDMAFRVPDHYEPRSTRFWVDENGKKWRSFGTICWYTNLDHDKRHEELVLYRKYYGHEEDYPHYANYDANPASSWNIRRTFPQPLWIVFSSLTLALIFLRSQ